MRTSAHVLPLPGADLLRPQLGDLADAVIRAIAEEVPGYARPMQGAFGRGVRLGVERALQRFLDAEHDPAALGAGADARSVYVELGRGEFRAGRSLDALQSAYRVGARVAWRRMGDAAAAAELAPEVLVRLGETIFAYIDELAAESVEGYAAEQSATAGRRERARAQLADLLARETPSDLSALAALAADAGWPLPERLVAVHCDQAAADALAAATGPALLLAAADGSDGGARHGFLADPEAPALAERLGRALGGETAWFGTVEGPGAASRSLGRADALARLLPAVSGDGAAGGQRWARDHLAELVLHADGGALAELASRRLAALGGLTPGARDRALATLRAYLDQQGSVTAMAPVLHLHPQTVRYRLARLRELLGDALDEPQARFELALALRDTERS